MSDTKYLLVFGCNGVKSIMKFNDIHAAYEYIIVHKFERGFYELFRAEKIINEDF
jgi:hypothetical protein